MTSQEETALAFLEWLANEKQYVVCRPAPATGKQLYEPIPFDLESLAGEWAAEMAAPDRNYWRLAITRSHIELRKPPHSAVAFRVGRKDKTRTDAIDARLRELRFPDGLGASMHLPDTVAMDLSSMMDEVIPSTKKAKRGDFAIGKRWRCDRSRKSAFDFVIVGPGAKPDTKRCRIEVLDPVVKSGMSPDVDLGRGSHGMVQEYSHRHIKRCARLVEA